MEQPSRSPDLRPTENTMTNWSEKWPKSIWWSFRMMMSHVQKTQIKIIQLIFMSVFCDKDCAQSLHHSKMRVVVEIIGTHDVHVVCVCKLFTTTLYAYKWCMNDWLHKWKDQFYVDVSYMNLPLDGVLAPQTIHRQSWAICCYQLPTLSTVLQEHST